MHPMNKISFMQQRRSQGLKHHEIGAEFGMSRQHVGRLLAQHAEPKKNMGIKIDPRDDEGATF